MSISLDFNKVDRLMETALEKGVFPGAVLLVAVGQDIVYHKPFGFIDLCSRRPVEISTLFDLASLTKPLATAPAVMALVEENCLGLDQPLSRLLPGFETNEKGAITISQLLRHEAGLPAWRPYYNELMIHPPSTRRNILHKLLLSEPLDYAPGEETRYSDIGFLILQWVVEHLSCMSLDRYVYDAVYRPLHINELFFSDTFAGRENRNRIAATEICPLRNRLLAGEVHDENAFFMGGVAGHAGLFGTAESIFRLVSYLSAVYRGNQEPIVFTPETVRRFLSRPEGSGRAHGFDVPSGDMPAAGRYFSRQSTLGHLGFTGVSFWIDLETEILVVLVSNRIHPSRTNMRIREFRPAIHDEIMLALKNI